MVETFGAHYVSLHVRVSNEAAIHLYRDTLGFQTEKTEAKYYADGEDAFGMRLDLAFIREQLRDDALAAAATAAADKNADVDEGDPVGDGGAKTLPERTKDGAAAAGDAKAAADKDKKRKVRVGRALGVGELVERDESKTS